MTLSEDLNLNIHFGNGNLTLCVPTFIIENSVGTICNSRTVGMPNHLKAPPYVMGWLHLFNNESRVGKLKFQLNQMINNHLIRNV